jgi:hypothetical protein
MKLPTLHEAPTPPCGPWMLIGDPVVVKSGKVEKISTSGNR